MKKIISVLFFILCLTIKSKEFDLAILGPIKLADGLGRVSLGIYKSINPNFNICFKPMEIELKDLKRLNISQETLNLDKNSESSVLIVSDPIGRFNYGWNKNILDKSDIKIAYSMFESTRLPIKWVEILNSQFDAIVVPDREIQKIYLESGVTKPIFFAPCPTFLEKFLKFKSNEKKTKEEFVFGVTGSFIQRKNFKKILMAFASEFKNNQKIKLILHSRTSWTRPKLKKELDEIIKSQQLYNVKIIYKNLTEKEYENFFHSIDCLLCLSKGEGFSFPPREALAAGIPVILSNNTAHKVICESGYVKIVESKLLVPGEYDLMGNIKYGCQFDCEQINIQTAMLDIYQNYSYYLNLTQKGRSWVKQYLPKNLQPIYDNLIKPKKILLGSENLITSEYLMTNNINLYKKYKMIRKNNE